MPESRQSSNWKAHPMIDISLLIITVRATIATLGKVRDLTKTMEQVEIKTAVAELANELADLQFQLAELKTQVFDLQEENARLKGRESSEKPKVEYSCYKFEGDKNLYCPGCYDTTGRKHLMVGQEEGFGLKCSVCKLTAFG